MNNSNLRERLIFVIKKIVPGERLRYRLLEQQTGVAQEKWKKMCNRKQNATAELIEAFCKLAPEYVQWVCIGELSDVVQKMPSD